VERALANFFTSKNLTRLREMALSEVANFLDRQQRQSTPAETQQSSLGQVMVAISSGGPEPTRLLRKAARLATQLNAQWYAVYVRTSKESAVRISAERQRQIGDLLETAQRMGGVVITLKNDDVPQALASFAREYGITHVVIGHPKKHPWWKRFKPSLHETLIHQLENVDIVIA
jgi:two-component system sensor histidine kinase KdpD